MNSALQHQRPLGGSSQWRALPGERSSLPSAGATIPDPSACLTDCCGRAGVPPDGAAQRRRPSERPGGASRTVGRRSIQDALVTSLFDGRFHERSDCEGRRDAKKQQVREGRMQGPCLVWTGKSGLEILSTLTAN